MNPRRQRLRFLTNRRPIFTLAALTAASLLLTGCNGSSSSEVAGESDGSPGAAVTNGAADAPATDADPEAPESIPVRYTQAGTSFTFANLLYAISEGYFEDEGLEMEYLPFPPSSGDVLTMVVAGEADVSFSAPSAFYSAVSQGRPVTQYATTQKGPMIGLGLHNDVVEQLAAEGVTPDSPLEDRIAALEGLRIASVGAGSSTFAAYEAALGAGGLSSNDVTHLPVPGHVEAVNAARETQTDGYVAAAPALLAPDVEGWGAIWFMYPEIPDIGDLPWAEFVARDDFVEEYPDAVPAMLRAIWKTTDDFANRPDHVKEVLKENWFEDFDQDLFDAAFELAAESFTQDILPDEEGLQRSIELYNATAENPIDLSFDEVYDVGPVQATRPS